ncbi:uncharacterized protein LOC118177855 [Oxyura jamaicensis]|uniref:uncharacterized protein LOC118177855 n=1 Tax=Oxyura jamaicensis TaxID=8884 RepID=UPI0015A565E1|nr:uncharacterized protein LOC118177855 [Oxyura jamaicensis]
MCTDVNVSSDLSEIRRKVQNSVCMTAGYYINIWVFFQARDAHCTCPLGYQSSSAGGRHCVRRAYDICRDTASRNEEGQCLTKKEWAHYCSEKVCTVPRDYLGYDKVLGLCICKAEDLESVCNSQCRRQQRETLQVTCTEKNAQLFITYRNGSKVAVVLEELGTVLLGPYFPLKDVCTSEQSKYSHPAYIVKTSGKGFLGVYNPDPQLFHNFIMLNKASSLQRNWPSSTTAPETTCTTRMLNLTGGTFEDSQRK